jgi:hypothetical protein
MTSFRQIAANRRNASKSTGPKTKQGKQRSRGNALRHGLTAETVVRTLEDARDYKAFEEAVAADFDAPSAVERELVLRLAGLLWRLRRATRIEAGLFDIQATHLRDLRGYDAAQRQIRQAIFDQAVVQSETAAALVAEQRDVGDPGNADPENDDLARCYLRLAHLPSFPLDRLNRYEAALWRQVAQTLFALNVLDRRKLHERQSRAATRKRSLIGLQQMHRK